MDDLETMPLIRLFQLYAQADKRQFEAMKVQAPDWMNLLQEFSRIQQVFDRRAIEEDHPIFGHIARARQDAWARIDARAELHERLGYPIVPTDEEIEGGDGAPT